MLLRQSEYIGNRDARVAFMTGFKGSAGTILFFLLVVFLILILLLLLPMTQLPTSEHDRRTAPLLSSHMLVHSHSPAPLIKLTLPSL